MQITITCELTARNLEILKRLCESEPENGVYTIHDMLVKHHKEVLSEPLEEHPVENPFPTAPTEEPTNAKYTKTDVKAICLKLSKEGKQDFLKQTFAKFGAKKLTEIAESDYAALMEELGNG